VFYPLISRPVQINHEKAPGGLAGVEICFGRWDVTNYSEKPVCIDFIMLQC
jgi:hypothetical protein